jgi:uncharacterized protein
LSPERLRSLLRIFKERHSTEYRLRALGYFGFYARDTATPSSDVDIVRYRATMNAFLKSRIDREALYV